MNKLRSVLGILVTLALHSAAHAGLLDLGTLGGSTSQAWGIRPDGTVVVGRSLNASAQNQAFAWTANADFTGGTMTALSFLSGGDAAEARAINSAGSIVGYSTDTSGIEQAVLWSGTTPTLLSNTLGGSGARAYGINAGSEIVGWARNSSGIQQAFVTASGTMVALDLATALPSSNHDANVHHARALGISPDGNFIVGEFEVAGAGGTEVHGFVYNRASPSSSYEISAGSVGSGRASNNTHAVGLAYDAGQSQNLAVFGRNSSLTTDYLPQLGGGSGVGTAINAAGTIVGSQTIAGVGQAATLWSGPSTSASVVDLNSLHSTGNTLVEATGIANTAGIYTGWGSFGGETRAFLLVVPEPSSGALALPVLVLLPCVLRRRRL